jgi:hypothetical protein
MMPGQAARLTKVGVNYDAAKRYYDKWSEQIRRSLEGFDCVPLINN